MASDNQRNDEMAVIKPNRNIVVSVSAKFREELMALIKEGVKDLTVDLEEIEMVDSDGLTTFIAVHNKLKRAGGKLHVVNASKDIYAFFRIMHLDRQIDIKMKRNINQTQR